MLHKEMNIGTEVIVQQVVDFPSMKNIQKPYPIPCTLFRTWSY